MSNPPYIRSADIAGLSPEVRDHDPRTALDGGVDGLDAYRALIPQAADRLTAGGALVVEGGKGQSGPIEALMTAAGLSVQDPVKPTWRAFPGPLRGEKCRDKSRIGTQKPLGILPGSDYVPITTSAQAP